MYPPPTDEQILAILASHGLPLGAVEPSPHEGWTNHVRMVGGLCVRVLKEEDYASDIHTEVVSVPALRAVGVETPELIVFDDSREVVPGLATVYRRVPGVPFGEHPPMDDPEAAVREIGRQIALWQTGLTSLDDPHGWLDKPRLRDPAEVYAERAERLSHAERAWTEATIRRLASARPGGSVFVHWDLNTHNVLMDRGRFTAVIDWGDAGWGEPAINHQRMPAHLLPLVLEPTGEVDGDLIGRCLAGVLAYALDTFGESETPAKPYGSVGHGRWRSLGALGAQQLPDVWRDWLGDGPPER